MKLFHRVGLLSVLMLCAAGLTYAAGSKEDWIPAMSYQTIPDETTIGSVQVPVSKGIRDWFTALGVDGAKIDAPLASLDVAYKDSIDTVVNDTTLRDALTQLIHPLLQAALVRGSQEEAVMRIGRHIWTMSIYGPEDHNN